MSENPAEASDMGNASMLGHLGRGVAWNILGLSIPLLAAFLTVPHLVVALGPERFGVITLVWALVAYGTAFDFGVGRAVTKLVSERVGDIGESENPVIIWTGLALALVLGVLGGGSLFALGRLWTEHGPGFPDFLVAELQDALYIVCLGVPLMTGVVCLRGSLEAHGRFDLTNVIRGSCGVLNYLAPLFVVRFSSSLVAILGAIVCVRGLSFLIHLLACIVSIPQLGRRVALDRSVLPPLLGFGRWITIVNLTMPMLLTADRLFVAGFVSLGTLAFYTIPYEIVTKLWLIPASVLGVLFPAFSSLVRHDHRRRDLLFEKGSTFIFACIFPLALAIVGFGREALELWIGTDFAAASFRILQILAVGIVVNAMSYVPYGLIQGAGRPDLVAKLLLAEVVPYGLVVWTLTVNYGLAGMAVAWVVRVAVEAVMFHFLARRYLGTEKRDPSRIALVATLSVIALIVLLSLPESVSTYCVVGIGFGYAAFLWNRSIPQDIFMVTSVGISRTVRWAAGARWSF